MLEIFDDFFIWINWMILSHRFSFVKEVFFSIISSQLTSTNLSFNFWHVMLLFSSVLWSKINPFPLLQKFLQFHFTLSLVQYPVLEFLPNMLEISVFLILYRIFSFPRSNWTDWQKTNNWELNDKVGMNTREQKLTTARLSF